MRECYFIGNYRNYSLSRGLARGASYISSQIVMTRAYRVHSLSRGGKAARASTERREGPGDLVDRGHGDARRGQSATTSATSTSDFLFGARLRARISIGERSRRVRVTRHQVTLGRTEARRAYVREAHHPLNSHSALGLKSCWSSRRYLPGCDYGVPLVRAEARARAQGQG